MQQRTGLQYRLQVCRKVSFGRHSFLCHSAMRMRRASLRATPSSVPKAQQPCPLLHQVTWKPFCLMLPTGSPNGHPSLCPPPPKGILAEPLAVQPASQPASQVFYRLALSKKHAQVEAQKRPTAEHAHLTSRLGPLIPCQGNDLQFGISSQQHQA